MFAVSSIQSSSAVCQQCRGNVNEIEILDNSKNCPMGLPFAPSFLSFVFPSYISLRTLKIVCKRILERLHKREFYFTGRTPDHLEAFAHRRIKLTSVLCGAKVRYLKVDCCPMFCSTYTGFLEYIYMFPYRWNRASPPSAAQPRLDPRSKGCRPSARPFLSDSLLSALPYQKLVLSRR
jgi:hypothetical protein